MHAIHLINLLYFHYNIKIASIIPCSNHPSILPKFCMFCTWCYDILKLGYNNITPSEEFQALEVEDEHFELSLGLAMTPWPCEEKTL